MPSSSHEPTGVWVHRCALHPATAQRCQQHSKPQVLGRVRTHQRVACVPFAGSTRGKGVSLRDLTRALAISGRPVIDATGLAGSFDFELTWTPDGVAAPSVGASLFTAVQEQLGLRLEPRQAPMNVLVIESAERATPD